MKRLAFWIIAGLVVVNMASRRESRARDEGRRDPHARSSARVFIHDQRQQRRVVVDGEGGQVVVETDSDGEGGQVVVATAPDGDDEETSKITITRGRVPHPPVPPVPPRPPAPPVPPPHVRSVTRWVKKGPPKPPAIADFNRPTPEWFPRDHKAEAKAARPDREGQRVVVGALSASPIEARGELRTRIRREVADWLSPDVPTSWAFQVSDDELNTIVRDSYVQPVLYDLYEAGSGVTFGAAGAAPATTEDLYTIYKAADLVDFSDAARDRLVNVHRRQLVRERMIKGGGILAFSLVCLSFVAGYIRADEATKGYYTKRLRLATLAGIGAAGYAGYAFYRTMG